MFYLVRVNSYRFFFFILYIINFFFLNYFYAEEVSLIYSIKLLKTTIISQLDIDKFT